MYLFRYRRQGATLRGASPQCLHDQGGFRRIPEDWRGLADAWKTACNPSLGWKMGAPSRTCVTASLHLQILSPRPNSLSGFAGLAGGVFCCCAALAILDHRWTTT